MANPSTTGPSGIGSEVLRRVQFNGLGDSENTILTVGTDMIITVLTLTICDIAGASGKQSTIFFSPDGSGACYLSYLVPLPANGTFVWNDKFVLTETDILKISCSSTNHDIYCSYIEQEFA
jgi:hypothetical protein